ncbi:MAG TPA: protein phosphatase CheZ [Bacteroidota bacterium]|nr:protein phosphatase CheZ [Bacteroidota bacterium]
MDNKEFSTVLTRMDELKALFSFGQRMMPIAKALFDFLQEIVPLLESINLSIQESNAKIPTAARKLNSVTQATELATTEILDLVDKIAVQITEIKSTVEGMRTQSENDKFEPSYKSIEEKLDNIEMNTNSIMMSLQVQDITSQQIAAVNHLMESVQGRLGSLVDDFGKANFDEMKGNSIDFPTDVTFDANAVYNKSTERQELANDVVSSMSTESESSSFSSQADIDALFAGTK